MLLLLLLPFALTLWCPPENRFHTSNGTKTFIDVNWAPSISFDNAIVLNISEKDYVVHHAEYFYNISLSNNYNGLFYVRHPGDGALLYKFLYNGSGNRSIDRDCFSLSVISPDPIINYTIIVNYKRSSCTYRNQDVKFYVMISILCAILIAAVIIFTYLFKSN